MTLPPSVQSSRKPKPHRASPADARRPSTSDERSFESVAASNLYRELKSLGAWSGAALGGAYALAARVVLQRLERLEDLNAERRFRQRSSAVVPPQAPDRRPAPPPQRPISPAK
jgi:hypothetical protein